MLPSEEHTLHMGSNPSDPCFLVAANLCKQIEAGDSCIIGLMIESNLVEGRQVPAALTIAAAFAILQCSRFNPSTVNSKHHPPAQAFA